MGGVDVLVVR